MSAKEKNMIVNNGLDIYIYKSQAQLTTEHSQKPGYGVELNGRQSVTK